MSDIMEQIKQQTAANVEAMKSNQFRSIVPFLVEVALQNGMITRFEYEKFRRTGEIPN